MEEKSDLRCSALDVVKYRPICRTTKAALLSGFYIVLVSLTKPFRPKIESVPKWFMNTIKRLTTGHEDLYSVR